MKCIKCGYELTGEENFCRNCGTPIKKDNTVIDEKVENGNNSDIASIENNLSLDKTNPSFKIDNTQELSIENSDSSKKIKKILDELKQNKSDLEVNSEKNSNNLSSDIGIQMEYDDNTKKLDKLLEKKQNDNDVKKDSTIIVDTTEIKNKKIKKEEQTSDILINHNENKSVVKKGLDNLNEESNILVSSEKEVPQNVLENEIYEEIDDTSNKDKRGKTIFLILLLILSICCIIFLIIVNLDLNNKLNNSTDKNEFSSNKNSNISNSNELDCNSSNKQLRITYNGYDFSKFDNITIENNVISFVYKNMNLKMSSKANIDFLDLKAAKDNYKKALETAGYLVSSYGTKVVSEKEYIFFEAKDSTQKDVLIVYTKGNNNDIIMFVIENEKNELNFDDLVIINDFINSLRQNSSELISNINYFIEK